MLVIISLLKLDVETLISSFSQKSDKTDEEKMKDLTNTEEIKDFYDFTQECLVKMKKILKPKLEQIKDKKFSLNLTEEADRNKKFAIFDLDETLVHCEVKHWEKCEVALDVKMPCGTTVKIGINLRPFIKEVLQETLKNYIIIIFTASQKSYADAVLNYLDPDYKIFRHRLYRENCIKIKFDEDYIYVKDLRIFTNIDLKKTVIIDNSVLSFAFQLENGIPVLPFYNNKKDEELKFLKNYLIHLKNVYDIREENKRKFKLEYFLKKASSENVNNFNTTNSFSEEFSMYKSEQSIISETSLNLNYSTNSMDKTVNSLSFKEQLFEILDDLRKNFIK